MDLEYVTGKSFQDSSSRAMEKNWEGRMGAWRYTSSSLVCVHWSGKKEGRVREGDVVSAWAGEKGTTEGQFR